MALWHSIMLTMCGGGEQLGQHPNLTCIPSANYRTRIWRLCPAQVTQALHCLLPQNGRGCRFELLTVVDGSGTTCICKCMRDVFLLESSQARLFLCQCAPRVGKQKENMQGSQCMAGPQRGVGVISEQLRPITSNSVYDSLQQKMRLYARTYHALAKAMPVRGS
jgi:hypothetical protein